MMRASIFKGKIWQNNGAHAHLFHIVSKAEREREREREGGGERERHGCDTSRGKLAMCFEIFICKRNSERARRQAFFLFRINIYSHTQYTYYIFIH